VNQFNATINETIAQPEIASEWAHQGATPMTMRPAEFDAFLRKDIEKWERVARLSEALSQ
jgi:tripartite-type tricarboxylate transporter receptor subunit TctC